MAYLKPQSPLQHKDGDYFYPLTTADQIIMEDGSRLNTVFKHTVKMPVTLSASGWSDTVPYTQTITSDEYNFDDLSVDAYVVYTGVAETDVQLNAAYSCLSYVKKNENSITFYCLTNKPEINIPIEIKGTCFNNIAIIEDVTVQGEELNFEIVGGTTQPIDTIENMIWVNTEEEITNWFFAAENPYIAYKDVELMNGLTFGKGYLTSSGTVSSSQTTANPELYTEDYIPVKYGTTYKYEYTVSATNSMWLAICEYTGSYTFSVRNVPVSSVSGTSQIGTYTPSSSSVTAVRLSWRTFPNTTYTMSFIEQDVEYTIDGTDEGTVWIATSTISAVKFNSIKNNGIQVYPISARQYVSGVWTSKETMIYQNGEWNKFFTYLYKEGNTFSDFTGGLVTSGSGGTATFNEDNIYWKFSKTVSSGNAHAYLTIQNPINLTECTILTVKISNMKLGKAGSNDNDNSHNSFRIEVLQDNAVVAKKNFVNHTTSAQTFTDQIAQIDISSIDGDATIRLHSYIYEYVASNSYVQDVYITEISIN